jgi:hypothetical protein
MNIPEGLVSFLAPIAEVFPTVVPEKWDRPAITYRLISQTELGDHDGPTGLVTSRYQLNAHADSHSGALALARQIRKLLNGFSGTLADGVSVDSVEVVTVFDLGEAFTSGAWQIATDLIIRHVEV